jgi:hypothetical protein
MREQDAQTVIQSRAAAGDVVLEACSALIDLADSIGRQHHDAVSSQVESLGAKLRLLAREHSAGEHVIVDEARRQALEHALLIGDSAFQQSIHSCVRAVLAAPLTESVDFVFP